MSLYIEIKPGLTINTDCIEAVESIENNNMQCIVHTQNKEYKCNLNAEALLQLITELPSENENENEDKQEGLTKQFWNG